MIKDWYYMALNVLICRTFLPLILRILERELRPNNSEKKNRLKNNTTPVKLFSMMLKTKKAKKQNAAKK
jgi:hypothetical protein